MTADFRSNIYTAFQSLFSNIEIQCANIKTQNEVTLANSFIIQGAL